MTKATITVLAILTVAIGFNLWLDSGCSLQGVMTAHGRACLK